MSKVNYNGKTVSDKPLKNTLESIAEHLGTSLNITSGDRHTALSMGGRGRSLHLAHTAADFHAAGLSDAQVFEQLKAKMNQIFDHAEAYEVIHHGKHTETKGEHMHVARYPASRKKAAGMYFKKEGLVPATKGKYPTEFIKFSNVNGVPVPPSVIEGGNVDVAVLSTGIGVVQSVGNGGRNIPPDVLLVQDLLNKARKKLKDANMPFQDFRPLVEDSRSGPKTIGAISIFQRDALKMNPPDGRVDPGGKTIRALYAAAYSTLAEVVPRTERIKTSPTPHTNTQTGEGGGANWNGTLAWGAHPKVSDEFRKKVVQICQDLKIKNPSWLMAVMAFETGETFSPAERNKQGSSGTGLIQFMKSTIDGSNGRPGLGRRLGITHSQLAGMTAVRQLDIVKAYFQDHGSKPAQATDVDDLYFLVLNPKGFGKDDDYALFVKGTEAYNKNNMDYNKDGKVSVAEVSAKVRQKLALGLSRYALKM